MEETILKRMYDLAYCAGVNNTTRPILKNKGLTCDECLQKIKDEQLILSSVMQALPKRLSNAAYIQATHKGYEEFMIWWDKQV
jgi:hypothetical protein